MKNRTLPALLAFATVFVGIFAVSSLTAKAQANQLMLADILIALRSKKVSLPERNKIISEAVAVRGVTFALSADIEKELTDTGADQQLIQSIRQKSKIIKVAAVQPPPVETKPKQEPVAAPDFSFYQRRADASVIKGDTESALADYSKAIEMNPRSAEAFMARAAIHSGKQAFDLAIADYDKVIVLNPKSSLAFSKRAELFEKKGNKDLALADYNKAVEFDPANEGAKAAAARITAEQVKAQQKAEPVTPPVTAKVEPAPEFVDLGQLSKAQAVSLATPTYPTTAMQANMGGKVVIDVTLDAEGKVTSAKTTSGAPFLRQNAEAAALRSKFKPAMFNGQPIKAKGYIVYNFTPQR